MSQKELRRFHEEQGIPFPVDDGITNMLSTLKNRAVALSRVRRQTSELLGTQPEHSTDLLFAARIVIEIGDAFDQIFLAQLGRKGESPKSWRALAPDHVQALTRAIHDLLQNPSHQTSFSRNPETGQMLRIILSLCDETDPQVLKRHQQDLEELAIEQYRGGKPILLFVLSDWYTNPNRPHEDLPQMLEPDCRLMLPVSRSEREETNADIRQAIGDLAGFLPKSPTLPSPVPVGIVGTVVLWAGSQLASYTVGEAMNARGFVFAENILKNRDSIVDVCRRSGVPYEEAVIRELVRRLFVLHELGHHYFTAEPFLIEVVTDIPTVASLLEAELRNDGNRLRAALACILGEYRLYAGAQPSDEASSEAYRLSSVFLLNALADHGLFSVTAQGSIPIDASPDKVRSFIDYLKRYHVHGHLRAITPNSVVHAFCATMDSQLPPRVI